MTNESKPAYFSDQMPDYRRDLCFKIIEIEPLIHPVCQRLYFLDQHFPLEKLDAALRWLIDNGLTGRKFLAWYQAACKGSDLELHRTLLSVVDNAKLAPIVSGRNFRA